LTSEIFVIDKKDIFDSQQVPWNLYMIKN